MIPDTPSSAASGMGELADELRSTTEEMACTCSVPMELWQKHSTAVLRAADALSAKDRELAEARAAKDGAYSERNQCVALIARFALAYGCRVGIAKTAIEGWDEAWHGCVYIDLPTGQVSWHYHDSEAHLFDFLPPYLGAWDGHTTPEKYERVSATFPIRPTETERERDEALAALRPFAEIADKFDQADPTREWGICSVLLSDLRRARSVLTPVSREQRGEEA